MKLGQWLMTFWRQPPFARELKKLQQRIEDEIPGQWDEIDKVHERLRRAEEQFNAVAAQRQKDKSS